jgi:serine/threonine protein kinase
MAPERLVMRGDVDHRADIYAVGVTLYECLVGEVPYPGTFGEVLKQALTRPVTRLPEDAKVPAHLADIVLRAIAVEPAQRHATAGDLERALARSAEQIAKARTDRPPAQQRRRYPRAPYVAPVRIVLADQSAIEGRSADISEGGLQVLVRRPCPSNTSAHACFPTPLSGRVVTVPVWTRWVRDAVRRSAIGLEFDRPEDELRREVASYVELLQIHDAPAS